MGSENSGAKEDIYSIYIGVDTYKGESLDPSYTKKHLVLLTENWTEYRKVYEALTKLVDVLVEVQGVD